MALTGDNTGSVWDRDGRSAELLLLAGVISAWLSLPVPTRLTSAAALNKSALHRLAPNLSGGEKQTAVGGVRSADRARWMTYKISWLALMPEPKHTCSRVGCHECIGRRLSGSYSDGKARFHNTRRV